MIINNKMIASLGLISICFAAEPQAPSSSSSVVIPPLKLGVRTIADHKKEYAEFYALLNIEPFIERLKKASSHPPLPSTLFRPDANGESINRFFNIINDVVLLSKESAVKAEKIESLMQQILEIFVVMESTALVFIQKANVTAAGHINKADQEHFSMAEMILSGTFENLKCYIDYLREFGRFIGGLMKSQKELFLLVASKKDLSNDLSPESLFFRVSQCDFSIDRLLRIFQEQLDQAYSLKSLLPSSRITSEVVLVSMVGEKESPRAATPRKRSSLLRSRSRRNLGDDSDQLRRGSSGEEITGSDSPPASSSVKSPKSPRLTPRGKKKD